MSGEKPPELENSVFALSNLRTLLLQVCCACLLAEASPHRHTRLHTHFSTTPARPTPASAAQRRARHNTAPLTGSRLGAWSWRAACHARRLLHRMLAPFALPCSWQVQQLMPFAHRLLASSSLFSFQLQLLLGPKQGTGEFTINTPTIYTHMQ